jgi:hypothetical protein
MNLRALILSAFGIFALSANGALNIALAPAVLNAARGSEVVFGGTLTNTSATGKIFLNDIHAVLDGSAATYLVLQPNTFFANVPGILLPGETYTGPIFRMALAAVAPAGDFSGTITLDGGANIAGIANLASAVFTILSPDVDIAATDPNASEFGPDTGTLAITRTGATTVALDVSLAITGSALNGTTYEGIAPVVTIPINAESATVTVTPILDHIPQGDRIATLSLSSSAAFNIGASGSATVTIHDTPADAWRLEKFGVNANDPAAADAADWDADGLSNLTEYALDLAPKTPDRDALPVPSHEGDYVYFSYVPNPVALDIVYAVEAATALGAWSAADVESITLPNPTPPNRVTVRYRHPISLTDHIFLRLNVARP